MKNHHGVWTVSGALLLFAFLILPGQTKAYYGDGCDQYGSMAYSSGGYCKCLSGYVFSTDYSGNKYCTSADSVCYEKYGYSSRYDTLTDSCKCSYGYVFGKNALGRTSCISEDQSCKDQYGYNARSTLGGQCECGYGYVMNGGQCTDGNYVCHSKNGIYSSYNDSSNRCECDSGYTLDDSNQCVEKQNNVYFKLLDIDTDNRQAIIKSEYDSSKYLITYGHGCYTSSINRYVNRDLVVNLGTDFYLDTYDKLVLQNDDETCDITHRERTYDDTLQTEDPSTTYYYAPAPVQQAQPTQSTPTDPYAGLTNDERCVKLNLGTFYNTNKQSCDTCSSGTTRAVGTNTCQKPVPVVKKVESIPARDTVVVKTPDVKKDVSNKIATTSQTATSTAITTLPSRSIWSKIFGWFKWW